MNFNYSSIRGRILDLIIKVKRWWKQKPKQYTFCYCVVCKNELCSTESFVSDTEVVRFKCSRCGSISDWDFDVAPFPILIRYQPISRKLILIKYKKSK